MAWSEEEHLTDRQERSPLVTWIGLGFLFVLFGIYLTLRPMLTQGTDGGQHPAVGQRLLSVDLQALTGAVPDIRSRDLQGKVVLLNFWGTWCPPCRKEFPHIAKLHEDLAGEQGFCVLAVSCGQDGLEDEDELRAATENFLERMGTTLPTYADLQLDTRKSVFLLLGQLVYPTTLVLDREGAVRGVWEGYTSGDEKAVRRLVEKLLADAEQDSAA